MSAMFNRLFAGVFFLIMVSFMAHAAELSNKAQIVYVENGWFGEGTAFHLRSGGIDGCPAANREFSIPKEHPSYDEMVALASAAYSSGSNVQVVAEKGECLFGDRTKALAIRLVK